MLQSPGRSKSVQLPSSTTNLYDILACDPSVPSQDPLELEKLQNIHPSPYPMGSYLMNKTPSGKILLY